MVSNSNRNRAEKDADWGLIILILTVMLVLFALSLAGCNTVRGVGLDIQGSVEGMARRVVASSDE